MGVVVVEPVECDGRVEFGVGHDPRLFPRQEQGLGGCVDTGAGVVGDGDESVDDRQGECAVGDTLRVGEATGEDAFPVCQRGVRPFWLLSASGRDRILCCDFAVCC